MLLFLYKYFATIFITYPLLYCLLFKYYLSTHIQSKRVNFCVKKFVEEMYGVMYVFCRKDVGLVTKSTCWVECRSSRAFV